MKCVCLKVRQQTAYKNAIDYVNSKEYERALKEYHRALEYSKKENIDITYSMAEINLERNEYDKAAWLLQSCYERTKDVTIKAKANEVIGVIIHTYLENYEVEEAIKFYDEVATGLEESFRKELEQQIELTTVKKDIAI